VGSSKPEEENTTDLCTAPVGLLDGRSVFESGLSLFEEVKE
jgi:hypothetical protein